MYGNWILVEAIFLNRGMPHTADPHGCARIWLLGFFGGEFFMYVMFLLTPYDANVNLQWSVRGLDASNTPCNGELSDWSGFSELRAEAASLNSAAAAGSHEKWMYETYGQDSVWINDEGMNPVRPGGVRLGARRRSIRPPSGVPTNQTLKKSRAVLKVNSESIQNAECLFSSFRVSLTNQVDSDMILQWIIKPRPPDVTL